MDTNSIAALLSSSETTSKASTLSKKPQMHQRVNSEMWDSSSLSLEALDEGESTVLNQECSTANAVANIALTRENTNKYDTSTIKGQWPFAARALFIKQTGQFDLNINMSPCIIMIMSLTVWLVAGLGSKANLSLA